MKKPFLIITLLIFFSGFGQEPKEFRPATEYFLTEIDSIATAEYWESFEKNNGSDPVIINLKNKKGENLFDIKISDFAFYNETFIEALETVRLKNIEEIIHLKSEYNSCCSNYYSTYLLKTEKGEFIELPEIEYMHCDGPTPIIEYRFPDQKFGIKNKILLTKSFLNGEYEVESIEIQKTYSWNGETLELEK